MSYYFTNEPGKKPNRKNISFRFLGHEENFISDDGVFSKDTLDFGSRVLLETIVDEDLKGRLLDVGCGLGYLGILLKKYHPSLDVTMIDINKTAVELAKENSELYRQNNTVLEMDGLSLLEGEYDIIVSNPPIRTGKQNVYRLLKEGFQHLATSGTMYIVMRKKQGAESAIKYLRGFADCQVINKENGYWIMAVSSKEDIA